MMVLLLITGIIYSCSGNPATPRPRGYLRVDFPEKHYRLFDSAGFPYRFEIPQYAGVTVDTHVYGYEPYWINLQMPAYNATIHISYKKIQRNLPEILDDTHNFVYRHVIKADAISEAPFADGDRKVYGMLYELEGNVASPLQFFATDSTRHFLRGSLYFFATPNADSLAPAVAFFKKDMEHIMETIKWDKGEGVLNYE